MSVKGEKYSSKAAMKRHEKTEGPKERKREYGTVSKKSAPAKSSSKNGATKPVSKSVKAKYSGGPSGFDFKKMARPAKKSTSPD